ncbi:hypothetical protein HMPREF9171_0907 [Streptococcus agalactiae ATCC 13813]|nr:hypothetical protein HMPREF9171_0907 [Streptococcus agalactiae ATCC 13813]
MNKNQYPKWEELPELDLYLDQVLLYVNQLINPKTITNDKLLTASMINNYVKHNYISKPIKKIQSPSSSTIDCYYSF